MISAEHFSNTDCYERFRKIEQAIDHLIFEVLGDDEQPFHLNQSGIKVFDFHDIAHMGGGDNSYRIQATLAPFGFDIIDTYSGYVGVLYLEQLLASVTWVEGSVHIVIYEDIKQYTSQKEEAIEFYSKNKY